MPADPLPVTSQQVKRFADLFKGRSQVYSLLPPPYEKGGHQVKAGLTLRHYELHLTGEAVPLPFPGKPKGALSLAVYPSLPPDNLCYWACTDHDAPDRNATLHLSRELEALGLPTVAEISKGKGAHLWAFFPDGVPSARARALLNEARRRAGNPPGEDFPKVLITPTTPWGVPVNLPYSPTASQGRRVGVDLETGQLFTLDDFLVRAERVRLSTAAFTAAWKNAGLPEPALTNASEEGRPFILRPLAGTDARTEAGTGSDRSPLHPCARALLERGTPAGQRNTAAFRLAIHHKQAGHPVEAAMARLKAWNEGRNGEPLPEKELADTVRSAYRGHSSTLGCEEEPMKSLCQPSCSVYLAQRPEVLRSKVQELREKRKGRPGANRPPEEAGEGGGSDRGRPTVPKMIWSGFLGELRDTLAPTTEAPEAYFAGVGLAAMGVAVGLRAWVEYGGNLFGNWFALCLGDSAVDHKSHILKRGKTLLTETFSELRILDAIASAEGFLQAMTDLPAGADAEATADEPTPGVPSLLVSEEFTAVLKKAQQKATANITDMLRNAYDSPPILSNPTRKNALWVKEPYLCVIAATTLDDLGMYLSLTDVANGFGNRFAYFTGPRDGVPRSYPPPPDPQKWERLKTRLRTMRERSQGEVRLSSEARGAWEEYYQKFLYPRSSKGGRVSQLTQRVGQFALKAALLYALDRGAPEIGAEDVERGAALGEYLATTAAYVAGELAESQEARYERRILKALREIGPAMKSELRVKIGGSNVPTVPFNRIMDALIREGTVMAKGAYCALLEQSGYLDDLMNGKGGDDDPRS